MNRKKALVKKKILVVFMISLMSLNSYAAIVSDNDGAAFITKAEFDTLRSSFQGQIDNYNQSIDSKIDGAIASYLAGITLSTQVKIDCRYEDMTFAPDKSKKILWTAATSVAKYNDNYQYVGQDWSMWGASFKRAAWCSAEWKYTLRKDRWESSNGYISGGGSWQIKVSGNSVYGTQSYTGQIIMMPCWTDNSDISPNKSYSCHIPELGLTRNGPKMFKGCWSTSGARHALSYGGVEDDWNSYCDYLAAPFCTESIYTVDKNKTALTWKGTGISPDTENGMEESSFGSMTSDTTTDLVGTTSMSGGGTGSVTFYTREHSLEKMLGRTSSTQPWSESVSTYMRYPSRLRVYDSLFTSLVWNETMIESAHDIFPENTKISNGIAIAAIEKDGLSCKIDFNCSGDGYVMFYSSTTGDWNWGSDGRTTGSPNAYKKASNRVLAGNNTRTIKDVMKDEKIFFVYIPDSGNQTINFTSIVENLAT